MQIFVDSSPSAARRASFAASVFSLRRQRRVRESRAVIMKQPSVAGSRFSYEKGEKKGRRDLHKAIWICRLCGRKGWRAVDKLQAMISDATVNDSRKTHHQYKIRERTQSPIDRYLIPQAMLSFKTHPQFPSGRSKVGCSPEGHTDILEGIA